MLRGNGGNPQRWMYFHDAPSPPTRATTRMPMMALVVVFLCCQVSISFLLLEPCTELMPLLRGCHLKLCSEGKMPVAS